MKNATIATSRTRATADHLITYRPLPGEWGDVDALRAVRERRALAADQGLDPSTLEYAAPRTSAPSHRPASAQRPATAHRPASSRRPSRRPVPAGRHRARPALPGLLAPMLGVLRGA